MMELQTVTMTSYLFALYAYRSNRQLPLLEEGRLRAINNDRKVDTHPAPTQKCSDENWYWYRNGFITVEFYVQNYF